MKYRTTLALVCLSACITIAPGASAETDPVAEGRAHFSRGVDYFKDEDYRNALVEFKRAYELAPQYRLLYNLGQTALELKDYAYAMKSLERYLADGGNEIPADRRAEVQATIRKLKQRVSEVTLTTNANDAEVFVDDQPAGRTPLSGPLLVSAGHRRITVTKGSATATRNIEVAGGDRTTVSLDIVSGESGVAAKAQPGRALAAPAESKAKAPSRTADQGPAEHRTNAGKSSNPTWLGVVTTGVLAVAAGVTGGLALSAKRDLDATFERYPITPGDVSNARRKTERLALATDILAGAAVLSCGITVWMAVSNSSENNSRVGVTVTPTGITARGSF